MNKKKKVVIVIPTRKGSKRVPSKNTKTFSDTTLLDIKINTVKQIAGVDDIIVNTDCPVSIAIAEAHNINTHDRDPYFASDEASTNEHWRHLAEVTDADIIMLGQTTSPLIKASTYENALNMFIENLEMGYDSLNTVSEVKEFLWQDGKPINYKSDEFPKSQDLPDIVALNFAITIITRESLLELGNVVGHKPYFLKIPKNEVVDIDDQTDFNVAESLYNNIKQRKQ